MTHDGEVDANCEAVEYYVRSQMAVCIARDPWLQRIQQDIILSVISRLMPSRTMAR